MIKCSNKRTACFPWSLESCSCSGFHPTGSCCYCCCCCLSLTALPQLSPKILPPLSLWSRCCLSPSRTENWLPALLLPRVHKNSIFILIWPMPTPPNKELLFYLSNRSYSRLALWWGQSVCYQWTFWTSGLAFQMIFCTKHHRRWLRNGRLWCSWELSFESALAPQYPKAGVCRCVSYMGCFWQGSPPPSWVAKVIFEKYLFADVKLPVHEFLNDGRLPHGHFPEEDNLIFNVG